MELARQPGSSVASVAKELRISEPGLRRWMRQDDVDAGRKEDLSSAEHDELVQLRRDKRRLEMENEILKRASAYFARENVLPKLACGWSESSPRTVSTSRWPAGCSERHARATTSGSTGHRPSAVLPTPIWRTRSSTSTATPAAPTGNRECTPSSGSDPGCGRVASGSPGCCGSVVAAASRATTIDAATVVLRRSHEDLVQRKFTAAGPDLLWCTDITEHPTRAGKV